MRPRDPAAPVAIIDEDLTPPPMVLQPDRSAYQAELEMQVIHLTDQLAERERQLIDSVTVITQRDHEVRGLRQEKAQLALEVNRLRRREVADDDITKPIPLPRLRPEDRA